MKIRNIDAFQIFDSRGNPTIEAVVTLDSGVRGHGLVPSGASTGSHEELELRDGDSTRFRGRSVFRAVEHARGEIAAALVGWDVTDQAALDRRLIELDGTPSTTVLPDCSPTTWSRRNCISAGLSATSRAAAARYRSSRSDWKYGPRGPSTSGPSCQCNPSQRIESRMPVTMSVDDR